MIMLSAVHKPASDAITLTLTLPHQTCPRIDSHRLLSLMFPSAPLLWRHRSLWVPSFSSSLSSSFYSPCFAQVAALSTNREKDRQKVLNTILNITSCWGGWMHVLQQELTCNSGCPVLLSCSSFFFMSVSQLSSSFMKPWMSSAFCRIWSCNSMALFPPDIPAKEYI